METGLGRQEEIGLDEAEAEAKHWVLWVRKCGTKDGCTGRGARRFGSGLVCRDVDSCALPS